MRTAIWAKGLGALGHEPMVAKSFEVEPTRLIDDDESDVYMRRDLVVASLNPGLLYRVREGLRRFRERMAVRPATVVSSEE